MFGGGFSASPVEGLLQQGFGLLQHGRVEEAWNAFHGVLARDPGNALAHHMVGIIAMQAGQLEMGVESLRRSIAANPDDPTAYGNLANGLRDLQRHDEAFEAYARALTMAPDFSDALNNRAILHSRLGRHAEALADYDRALRISPQTAHLHNNRGEALIGLGRTDEALRSYEQALALDPDIADAHYNRANLLAEALRREEAVEAYGRTLSLRPDYVEALVNLGNVLIDLDRSAEALEAYDRALALQADLAQALSNRANALRAMGRSDEALISAERALELGPADPQAHTNRGAALLALGRGEEAVASFDAAIATAGPGLAPAFSNRANALRLLGRHAEALASCDTAIRLDPAYPDPLHNRAAVLGELGRYEEAIASYEACLELSPERPEAWTNLGTARLMLGDYERGWAHYEWRKRLTGGHRFIIDRAFAEPEWDGGRLDGKTILLHSEQGLGDTLQFCRYAALVKAAGAAEVILEVEPPLVRLLGSLPGADRVVKKGDPLPAFDVQALIMSLPHLMGTTLDTVPADIPYLFADAADAARWKARLGERTRPRVGLVWSGGFRPERPEMWNLNGRRNIALEKLRTLAGADVDFYSLQKGQPAEGELAEAIAAGWGGPEMIDLTSELKDFADTAALVEALDLVIAVDTSTLHLAGALGKPVWVLNRFDSCWRWLLDRADSPWYPTLRLFRQTTFGDWDPVVEEVRAALDQFAAG